MNDYLIAICVLATLSAACYTTIIRRLAPRLGLLDRPDGHRKIHGRPIPLGGGGAVLLALATVVGVLLFVPNPWALKVHEDWLDVVAFAIACSGIVALGLADDRFNLRGRFKLFGQTACVLALLPTGLVINNVALFGWNFELGPLCIPLTVLWMLGAINAINLLDGIDGLAATLGIILNSAMASLAFMTGHDAIGALSLVFAASILGFLPFNLPPARIYLGDAGSMLIGLMLGAMSIHASLKGPGTLLLAAPLTVLTIPVFDSAAAILRRRLTGRSIYETDRGHLHHQLLDRLGSNVKVLICVGVVCTITSLAALGSVAFRNDWIAFACSVAVVGAFIATGLFGRGEFLLLLGKARDTTLSILQPTTQKSQIRQSRVHLQGTRQWDLLWETVTESAEKLSLAKIRLDLNLPQMREGYNATWQCDHQQDLEDCWSMELPLVLGQQTVGRLSICGHRNGHSSHEDIAQFLEMLEPFEEKLVAISEDLPSLRHRVLESAS